LQLFLLHKPQVDVQIFSNITIGKGISRIMFRHIAALDRLE